MQAIVAKKTATAIQFSPTGEFRLQELRRQVRTESDTVQGEVISEALRWARAVEQQVAKGSTVKSCFQNTVDRLKINPSLRESAAKLLTEIWAYGNDIKGHA